MTQTTSKISVGRFESLPLRKEPIITEETNIRALQAALKESGADSVPIRDENKILGYLRPHEILKAISLSREARKNYLRSGYYNDQISIEAREPIFAHLDKILAGPDGPIIVTQSSQFLGYIPRRQLLEIIVKQLTITLEDISDRTQHVIIQGNATIYTAYKAMLESSCEVTIIVDQDSILIGIFTAQELPPLIEAGYDLWNTKIDAVMKEPAFITQNASLNEAYQVILRTGKKQLVIINNEGRPKGVVEDEVIFKKLHPTLPAKPSNETEKHIHFGLNTNSNHLSESLIIETVLNRTIKTGIIGLDEDLNIIYINPAAKEFLHEYMVLGSENNASELPKDTQDINQDFYKSLSDAIHNKEQFFTITTEKGRQSTTIQCKLSPIEQRTEILGYVLAMQDVTDQKQTEENIRQLAYYDSLTSLPNRVLFNERMSVELKRVKRSRERMAFMVLDLDGFKDVNDQYGHIAGDRLLRIVAQRLKKLIRESDTIGRFGGDEFTFIFPNIHNSEGIKTLKEKLQKAIRKPIRINHEKTTISASIGVAFFPDDGKTQKTLFKKADKRMYKEKEDHKKLQSKEHKPKKKVR